MIRLIKLDLFHVASRESRTVQKDDLPSIKNVPRIPKGCYRNRPFLPYARKTALPHVIGHYSPRGCFSESPFDSVQPCTTHFPSVAFHPRRSLFSRVIRGVFALCIVRWATTRATWVVYDCAYGRISLFLCDNLSWFL